MRNPSPFVALLISLLFLPSILICQPMPDVWKNWLEKDVSYIITAKEREVFLALKSEKERQAFRDAFWLQRDPTPGTPVNEFRDEHYRRLQYANEHFGRGTIKEGWETDMGRIHIILGEPVDRQRFYETSANTVPIELWQYYVDTSLGLPPIFYILFYQDLSMGDYRLYSPSFDGPQRLLRDYSRQSMEKSEAYLQLSAISAELAEASLSLIPGTGGDPSFSLPSHSSDMLIATIHQLPQKKVQRDWAEAFARHKEIVTTDYSISYVGSHHALFVHQENGQNYLHCVIEPSRVSMSQYEDKVYASFQLNVMISDLEGETIHQEEKSIHIEMTPEEFKKIERQRVSIGDIIPLVAGNFKVDILLRNTNSKEFSSLEEKVTSPRHDTLAISPLLFLSHENDFPAADRTTAFVFEGRQLYPNTQRLYAKSDPLLVYFEIYHPTAELEAFLVDVVVLREEDVMTSKQMRVGTRTSFLERLVLQDYRPGYYSVAVRLTDPEGNVMGEKRGEFVVSSLAAIPRPWSFNKVYPSLSHPYFAMIRAYQYLSQGENDLAIHELEPLHDASRPHRETAKLLARAYMNKKDFHQVLHILEPMQDVQDVEILDQLGKSHFFSGDYKAAVDFFKKALVVGGEILDTINSIGISYLRMERQEEALPYFERSLKLSPDQPEIREIFDKIKKKDRKPS